MQQIEELFTFKNFIINKSNQLAYNVLKKESIAYETIYNPLLFIYGSTGSGKTHLLKVLHIIVQTIQVRPYMSMQKILLMNLQ